LWSKITAGAANIANLISQTVAQWNLNAAVYAGCPPMLLLAAVILIVVAAIALAVLAIVGLVAMFKKMKENTIDGQIAKTKERLQEFTEASEAAKDSLDEMQAAQDEYNNLQDGFKDLVEGTQEWNKALLEANANVLSLIQKYPELAGYMENIDGRLTINEEGWEKL
jgi:predicted nuclease with TOPRIM domain